MKIDEASKTMTMVAMGGHIIKKYNSYKIQNQVIPKGESIVSKISVIYEKMDENHDHPHD